MLDKVNLEANSVQEMMGDIHNVLFYKILAYELYQVIEDNQDQYDKNFDFSANHGIFEDDSIEVSMKIHEAKKVLLTKLLLKIQECDKTFDFEKYIEARQKMIDILSFFHEFKDGFQASKFKEVKEQYGFYFFELLLTTTKMKIVISENVDQSVFINNEEELLRVDQAFFENYYKNFLIDALPEQELSSEMKIDAILANVVNARLINLIFYFYDYKDENLINGDAQ